MTAEVEHLSYIPLPFGYARLWSACLDLLKEAIKSMLPLVDLWAGTGHSDSLTTPYPFLGMYILLTVPILTTISGAQTWESKVL